jgi:hypothetical protein
MTNQFRRLFEAVRFGYIAWKSPDIMRPSILASMTSLFELIFKAATERRPMMTRVAFVCPLDFGLPEISIWVGIGSDSSPDKRISELLRENDRLKSMLSELP